MRLKTDSDQLTLLLDGEKESETVFFPDFYLQWIYENSPDVLDVYVNLIKRMKSGDAKICKIYSILSSTMTDEQITLLNMLVDEFELRGIR